MQTVNRTWFITGASSGIGLEVTRIALANGDNVAAAVRNTDAMKALCMEYPYTLKVVELDVSGHEDINTAVEYAEDAFGEIDIVFSNAGRALVGALEETSVEQIEQCIAVNLLAHIHLAKAVVPYMRIKGKGHILFNSAIAAYSNYTGFSVYGAAKYALEGLAESLKGELAPFGITVGLLYPGPTRTGFVSNSLDVAQASVAGYERTTDKFRKILNNLNGKQPGDPAKIAQLVYNTTVSDQPPFRLFMGAYAHKKVHDKLVTLQAELEINKDACINTDFAS